MPKPRVDRPMAAGMDDVFGGSGGTGVEQERPDAEAPGRKPLTQLVGAVGFEPTTPSSQSWCATPALHPGNVRQTFFDLSVNG